MPDGAARCSDDARVLHADLVVERAQHQLEHHAAHHDDGHGHGACARAQRTVRGERGDLLEEGGAHDEDAGHEDEQVEAGRLDGLRHRGALVGLGGCGLVGRIVLLARAERKQAHDRGALAHDATVSTTDSTVVTMDSAARAVCQPNWLISSWPMGLATAAKMDSVAA